MSLVSSHRSLFAVLSWAGLLSVPIVPIASMLVGAIVRDESVGFRIMKYAFASTFGITYATAIYYCYLVLLSKKTRNPVWVPFLLILFPFACPIFHADVNRSEMDRTRVMPN